MNFLRQFATYYKPYKFLFFADMVCALVVSAVDLAFPLALNYLVQDFFTKSPSLVARSLVLIGALLLAGYALRCLCQYFITSWGHIMGARMESDMRRDLFHQYQRLSFSYYDRNNTGDMISKLVNDLFDISELAHHGPENLLISLLKIIGSFVILLLFNVRITLLLFVVTMGIIVFSVEENNRMKKVFYDNRVKIAGVNSRAQDSLEGIRVVKSFAGEGVEKRKFDESNRRFLQSKVDNYRIMGRYFAGNSFFEGLLYIVVLIAGGLFISRGAMRPTDLMVYILYINIYINPIDVLVNFTEQFQKGYAGFRRFQEVLSTQPEIRDLPDAEPLTDVHGDIEYRHVSFSYDSENTVLHDINLSIPHGSTVALVGPSGGGKTTLCSLLPRFYDVREGVVAIDGRDVRSFTLQSLRGAIGIVQQDVYLFGGTIGSNIAYGREGATREEVIEAAREANIHDFIMSLPDGYDTDVGERGVRLSGGQKQRISIARVFLKNPPILILDEATSALDNESERFIQKSLERLSKNRTTIVIAHRLSTIRNAGEILVMTDEGIAERGTHTELLKKDGIYARYYNMQFEGLAEE